SRASTTSSARPSRGTCHSTSWLAARRDGASRGRAFSSPTSSRTTPAGTRGSSTTTASPSTSTTCSARGFRSRSIDAPPGHVSPRGHVHQRHLRFTGGLALGSEAENPDDVALLVVAEQEHARVSRGESVGARDAAIPDAVLTTGNVHHGK